MKYVRKVIIPYDAIVCIGNNVTTLYRTNKFILEDPLRIELFLEQFSKKSYFVNVERQSLFV